LEGWQPDDLVWVMRPPRLIQQHLVVVDRCPAMNPPVRRESTQSHASSFVGRVCRLSFVVSSGDRKAEPVFLRTTTYKLRTNPPLPRTAAGCTTPGTRLVCGGWPRRAGPAAGALPARSCPSGRARSWPG